MSSLPPCLLSGTALERGFLFRAHCLLLRHSALVHQCPMGDVAETSAARQPTSRSAVSGQSLLEGRSALPLMPYQNATCPRPHTHTTPPISLFDFPRRNIHTVPSHWWFPRKRNCLDAGRGGWHKASVSDCLLLAAYWPLATALSDPLWARTCCGCVTRGGGGVDFLG